MNVSTMPQIKYGPPPPSQVFLNYLPEILVYALLPIAFVVGLVIYFKKKRVKKNN